MNSITLDVHTHLVPVSDDLEGLGGVSWDAAAEVMMIDGHRVGIKSLFRPQALLEWMETEGVGHAWISAPPPTYRQHLRGSEARAWARYLNEELSAIASMAPDRLTALPHLAIQDLEAALGTVDVWAGKGVTHFSMPTGTGDERTISDAKFTPLWERLHEIGVVLFLHPGSCADGRLKSFYLENLLGNPSETAVAISHFVLGGIVEKYPGITPCFAHGGGTFPMAAARIQRGYETARPGLRMNAAPPKDLYSRIMVDCICHNERPLELAEETFGKDNVIFGSDWPFPMGLLKPHDQTAGYDADRLERVFRTSAKRLLNPRK